MGVPDAYREASFGLGAGKLRTVFKVVLPSAIPGILSGVVLATGRIVGETGSPDLYCRCCVEGSIQSDGIRTYPGSSYVCAFQ